MDTSSILILVDAMKTKAAFEAVKRSVHPLVPMWTDDRLRVATTIILEQERLGLFSKQERELTEKVNAALGI